MKRIVQLLLVALLAISVLAGCQQDGQGTTAKPTEMVEISMIVWDRGSIPSEQGTLESNWWTEYVNKQMEPLGVKVTYIVIPRAQEAELLSTQLAANTAPDISKTNTLPLLATYITGGGVADLTPHINNFGENIKGLYTDEQYNAIQIDGKIYALPHVQNDILPTTWIRKDWLDDIGMAVPGSIDELYAVLKEIKAKDPGGIGNSLAVFGLQAWNAPYWNTVVLPGFSNEAPSAEKLLTPFQMWPETKDLFKFLNKLYNEGLLTDFVLDKDESLFRQKIARGEIFAAVAAGHYPYHSAYGGLYDKLLEADAEAELISIQPWKQNAGDPFVQYFATHPMFGYRFFVPASSTKVEAAVKFLNFFSDPDAYMTGTFGIEGEDFNWDNDVAKPIDREKYLGRVPWIEPQYGLMCKPFANSDKDRFVLNYIRDFNPKYHEQIIRESMFRSDLVYFTPVITSPIPTSDKVTPTLTSYWDDELYKLIMAPINQFDVMFDATIAEFKNLGGDDKAEELIAAYKAQTGN